MLVFRLDRSDRDCSTISNIQLTHQIMDTRQIQQTSSFQNALATVEALFLD